MFHRLNSRKFLAIIFAVLACAAFIHADDSPKAEAEAGTGTQIKEGATNAGHKIADGAASGYDSTKTYLNDKTVSDIGGDVADGAKSAGKKVVDGTKSLTNSDWKLILYFFLLSFCIFFNVLYLWNYNKWSIFS